MEPRFRVFRFGPFVLDATKRQLLRGSEPVKLFPKEFDTLLALVEQHGRVVEKDELLRTIWPGSVVEEGNLTTHVSHLRKVLGGSGSNRDYIATIPGRGYEFVADVTAEAEPDLPAQASTKVAPRRYAQLLLAAVILVLAATAYVALHPSPHLPSTFQQLTFRRGTIWSARFAPDGQTIVYGAAWEGQPIELFSTRIGGPESTPLGQRADVLSISSSGEMAISLGRRFSREWESSGTLARVSLGGGTPREVLANVKDADWSPDGAQLAIVRRAGVSDTLEFPAGRPIYDVQGFIMRPRVSPRDGGVAFLQRRSGEESVELVLQNGTRRTLAPGANDATGLAWSPDGAEVLFTVTSRGSTEVHAVTTDGRRRLVTRVAGEWTLNDIAADGRALMTQDFKRGNIFGAGPGAGGERDLSWLDRSVAVDLSADGELVLLAEVGAAGGASRGVYVRRSNGAPAVHLGDGEPAALSPDGKWVIAIQGASPERLALLPTGAGETRVLPNGPVVDYYRIKWLPGGTRILFGAIEPGSGLARYVQDVMGGPPQPLGSRAPLATAVFIGDEEHYVSRGAQRRYYLFTADAEPPRLLDAVTADDHVIQASADGRSVFVMRPSQTSIRVDRVDIETSRRTAWKEIAIPDAAGVMPAGPEYPPFLVTPDGSAYVYNYLRVLSNLFVVEGLFAGR